MNGARRLWMLWIGAALGVAALAVLAWFLLQPPGLGPGFAESNGRIEATEVDIATQYPGRIAEILVDEGDHVTRGEVLARMDARGLVARRDQADAQIRQAESALESARSTLALREAQRRSADALLTQRIAERRVARQHVLREQRLLASNATSRQLFEDAQATYDRAAAAVTAAEAEIRASQAAVEVAKSENGRARAAIEAAQSTKRELEVEIDESTLRAPRAGRVQYRVAQPGEVLGAGMTVLNMIDLGDIYMTCFLPTNQAGRVAIGAQARIVLDALPDTPIPAVVSYVSDVAQFTPKTVETATERQKLTFRIKVRIPPAALARHGSRIKPGMPGMAYVRLDPGAAWPERLAAEAHE